MDDLHHSIKAFRDAQGELPETVYLPADDYDCFIEQAEVWYPQITFVRDEEICARLLVQRDPESIC